MVSDANSSPQEVWHYTTAAGLKGIIENNYLLAGPASQMNDSREIIEGYEAVLQHISTASVLDAGDARIEALSWLGTREDAVAGAARIFTVSASSNGDNLSLWRAYGASSSYAIKLDPDTQLLPVVDPGMLDGPLVREDLPGLMLTEPLPHCAAKTLASWEPVDYQHVFARQLVDKFYSAAASASQRETGRSMAKDHTLDLMARMKHSSFYAEQEVRKSFRVARPDAFHVFRDTSVGMKRFIRVGHSHSQEQDKEIEVAGKRVYGCIIKPEKLPILEIKLSPTGHQLGAKETIESFLATHGRNDVPVTFSASPYTG